MKKRACGLFINKWKCLTNTCALKLFLTMSSKKNIYKYFNEKKKKSVDNKMFLRSGKFGRRKVGSIKKM